MVQKQSPGRRARMPQPEVSGPEADQIVQPPAEEEEPVPSSGITGMALEEIAILSRGAVPPGGSLELPESPLQLLQVPPLDELEATPPGMAADLPEQGGGGFFDSTAIVQPTEALFAGPSRVGVLPIPLSDAVVEGPADYSPAITPDPGGEEPPSGISSENPDDPFRDYPDESA